MNFHLIFYIIGWILQFESLFLCVPMITGLVYREGGAAEAFLITAAACLIVGRILVIKKPRSSTLYLREGFFVVALGWIIMSAFGAAPFVISGDIPNYVDALFEIISGLTTTGASILSEVEPLSHAALMWRSFSHWVGGMGVFVFIMAILPLFGGHTMNLMKAESPGPSVDKFVPKVKDTAKILYGIYIVITAVEIVLLIIFKMPVFDALTLSFGTTGTGGFAIRNSGLADYTAAQQYIITIFMILSGVNYAAYFLIIRKRFKDVLKLSEVKFYFIIIVLAIAGITVNCLGLYGTVEETFRHAAFTVGSIITTTGYSTTDFNLWPSFSKTIIVFLMFSGACAGSTGGGVKVSRLLMALKSVKREIQMLIHPRAVKKIHMDGAIVSEEVIRQTNVFFVVYVFILIMSVIIISVDNFSFTTNMTAVIATLNNIGPGLEVVGPAGNFGSYSILSKIVLMFDMLAGRLELFPMLILFYRGSWQGKVRTKKA